MSKRLDAQQIMSDRRLAHGNRDHRRCGHYLGGER